MKIALIEDLVAKIDRKIDDAGPARGSAAWRITTTLTSAGGCLRAARATCG
ncbi:hypothetical protein NKJ90_10045 [Mesorhizobium sp. M0051]|uniref:hypothetical protein n=1 Tax=Mesorhizobium sp. M0051 TaxID=2956862 RepID=UPI00333CFCE4